MIIRTATPEDLKIVAENRAKEKDAFQICLQKIAAHKLEMKLVEVEYTFDRSKIMFYFTADGRVDFRELVKDLASVFRTRIELRQIGVRDESKLLGGLRHLWPSVLLQHLFRRFSIRLHQNGEGAGNFPQPGQDQRHLRPADVLPEI